MKYEEYVIEIANSEDVDFIQEHIRKALNDNNITPKQFNVLYKLYEKAVKKEKRKASKEIDSEGLYQVTIETRLGRVYSDSLYGWQIISRIGQGSKVNYLERLN